ncbi:MAG: T9SS type A sorting domain-containing protein [Cyclobacteriaceae bacterium]|nr:T9SS type A sorting domain-containing protein [Cyclobacteriaceae bacterium]
MLNEFEPGVVNSIYKSFCDYSFLGVSGSWYGVDYEFSYSPPIPYSPTIIRNSSEYSSGIICADEQLTLVAKDYVKTTTVPNGFLKPEFASKVDLIWEYQLNGETESVEVPNPAYCGDDPSCNGGGGGGIGIMSAIKANSEVITPPCCNEPPTITVVNPVWRPLGVTNLGDLNNGSLSFVLNSIGGLSTLTKEGFITFRVKARAGSLSSAYSSTKTVDVAPITPKAASISVTPSCTNASTGVITVSGITAPISNFRVIATRLEDGPNAAGYFSTYTGSTMPATVAITNLPVGTYSVELSYASIACNTVYTNMITSTNPIKIGTYAPRTISASIVQNASCQGYQDGIIRVSSTGGNGSNPNYTIIPNVGSFVSATNEFQNLPADTYTIRADDGCVAPVQLASSITITQPTRVSASYSMTHPTCLTSPNGIVSISSVTGGSGVYNYQLLQGSSVIRSSLNSSETTWLINDLPGGNYQIDVRDAVRPSCPGYEPAPFDLNPASPLQLNYTATVISCYGANDGRIQLQASGGSGNYRFQLTNATTSEVIVGGSNSDFKLLKKGNYTAQVINSNSCPDVFSIPNIVITEPDDILFSFTTTKIKCAGEENGKIAAVVTGGNGNYVLQWQFNEGNGWTNYTFAGGQTLSIDKLFPAQYRLRVISDAKNCSRVSDVVTIVDPPTLELQNIAFTHVTCLDANDGTITPAATGGWGNYTYQYSLNGGNTYAHLLPSTRLTSGSYQVRAIDEQGCSAEYAQSILITQPATKLSATYTLSQYAGFNVSCSNGNDGQITINASGGNDGPFANGSYSYSIDASPFTNSNSVSGLPAGSHQLQVMDLRGCIFSEQITLSAPAPIQLTVVDKNYIKCFGDNSGIIEVTATGGLPSYQFKIDNGSFQTASQFVNLTGGVHTITVRDKNLCLLEIQEVIDSPNPPLILSVSKTDVLCFGLANGSVNVNVQGGKAPFQYTWLNRPETANQLNNLQPGDYAFQVVDQENCSKQTTVTIRQPDAPLSATTSAIPVQCKGDTNGKINISAAGGTVPYSYSKDGGVTFQSTSEFVNLAPGNYKIAIRDANACSVETNATIIEPSELVVQLVAKNDVRCFGAATGSVEVAASGGVAPYMFSADGLVYQSSSLIGSLTAGLKTIYVRDQYGCVRTLTTTLSQPAAPLTITSTVTPVRCKGESNGTILVVADGGTQPYTYKWNGLSETSAQLSNLSAANYTITIRDANSCELAENITITEPSVALNIKASQRDVSCFGAADGTLKLMAEGGYAPYQYSFHGAAYSSVDSYQSLSPQFYSISARDAMGCIVVGSATIVEPLLLKASIRNQKQVSCYQGNDGVVELNVSGGTAPFQYSKDGGSTFQSIATFEQLIAGNYPLVVKDANGCVDQLSVTVTEPTLLQSTISNIINAACGQANGSATITAQGGTSPYQYQWKNQLGQLVSTLDAPANLLSGFYQISITDSNQCSTINSVTISDDDGPVALISSTIDASCFNSTDGAATVTASGGSGGYTYQWSDGQTNSIAKNLARGTYYVTVTDSRGCKSLATATIGSPAAIDFTLMVTVMPQCFESCDGSVELLAKNGVAPYTYAWQNGETAIDGKATQLCKGEHRVVVTGADGCTAQFSVNLSAPPLLEVDITNLKLPGCFGACDGSLSVQAKGGTSPYQYEWSGAGGWTTSSLSNLCSGTYEVKITDAHQCSVLQSIKIDEAPPLAVDLGPDVTLCYQQKLSLDAGNANATYTWKKDAAFFSNQQVIEVADAGLYEVVVENATGCVASDQIIVSKSATVFAANFLGASELVVSDTLLLTEVCFPKPDDVKWTLSSGLRVIGYKDDQPMVKASVDGEYTVHLLAHYKECTDQTIKKITFFKDEDKGKIGGRMKLGNEGIKLVTTYPNPTSGNVQIQVQLYEEQTVAMFLYTLDGLEIARSTKNGRQAYDFDIDLSNYPAGVYVAKIATDYQQKDVRIVLVK